MQDARWIITLTMVGLLPSGALGQRLADWPVRTSALPDAIVQGTGAVFWNPAGLSAGRYRGNAMIINLRAPQTLDLTGLASAGSLRFERTVLAAAYEHVGINGFTRTDDSPGGPEAVKFDLGEDHFTLAAAHQVGRGFAVGAVARYARDDLSETDAAIGLGAGFMAEPELPLRPLLGAYALSESDDVVWGAAIELRLPALLGPDYQLGLAYGAQGDAHVQTPVHRFTTRIDWDSRASVSAGLTREPDFDGARWAPMLAASLRLNRYTLGVVRENLVNDFGASYAFRLQVGLGQ